jgi:hypothetical protein
MSVRYRWISALTAFALLGAADRISADTASTADGATIHPKIQSNRWAEDWSPLVDPALRREPWDDLKYIRLGDTDPDTYLSFGLTLRERFESNSAPLFGVDQPADNYDIQRLQVHADLRVDEHWQTFVQLEDDRAYGKPDPRTTDKDQLDLRLAFIGYADTFGDNTFKSRIGRQDFAFDLQRFVSSRDGPNVRQSFDAVWGDWETGTWRVLGFVSRPVQYRNDEAFDDTSNNNLQFSTLRIERHVLGTNELSAYYALYQRRNAQYLSATGNERRDALDVRFAGVLNALDWDTEVMYQVGSVGTDDVRAWAVGVRGGCTFSSVRLRPRIGLQIDASSGDGDPNDKRLETFNPLFPNGNYYTLAGYIGDANLIHVKPSITIAPIDKLTVMVAVGVQMRVTTDDAVYAQPNVPVPNTAGRGGRWSGTFAQLRTDYAFSPNLTGAIETFNEKSAKFIHEVGGHDGNYLGVELKFSW